MIVRGGGVVLASALVACGGSRFGLLVYIDAEVAPQADTFAAADSVDSSQDAGSDTDMGEEVVKLYFDSSPHADAFDDTEADTDVDAAPPIDASDAPVCTPIPQSSHPCGAGISAISPEEYCAENGVGNYPTNKYQVRTTPLACQCAETWGCACLRANVSDLCVGIGSYDGSPASCQDTSGLVVNCPRAPSQRSWVIAAGVSRSTPARFFGSILGVLPCWRFFMRLNRACFPPPVTRCSLRFTSKTTRYSKRSLPFQEVRSWRCTLDESNASVRAHRCSGR